ncbi:hypothetical protein LCGC14_2936780, partial [marine sediment metagenome]
PRLALARRAFARRHDAPVAGPVIVMRLALEARHQMPRLAQRRE